uniref:Uncharacterized protein n=1 Tax=Myotis myotis TaxID=51298 RepID=A0A7J7Z4J9_MYOMY|nr:hypothetical protein mMyoMyo1_010537 [Myotis myotis]
MGSLSTIEERQPCAACPHLRSSSCMQPASCTYLKSSSCAGNLPPSKEQQPAPVVGAAATRADCTHLRSGNPAQSALVQGGTATYNLHVSDEQQLGEQPASIQGAAAACTAHSHLRSNSCANSPSPNRGAAAM